MKLILSLLVYVLIGALLIAIAVQTAALIVALLTCAGSGRRPFAAGRRRRSVGACAGIAAGSSLIGLLPFGVVLGPLACGLGLRVLFALTWRTTAVVLLASIAMAWAIGWALPIV